MATTYGNEVISVGGHRKNTDLRNCSLLSKQCTKSAFRGPDIMPKEVQITATAMAAIAAADEHYYYDNHCI